MQIRTLDESFALVQLEAAAAVPEWVGGRDLIAVVRTRDELSIVCRAESVPETVVTALRGFRGLAVAGSFDVGVTGLIASLSKPLAEAGISIFSISTYDTDYILVRAEKLAEAKAALAAAGFDVT